jgi:two-component system CheB/CheR fusion protein
MDESLDMGWLDAVHPEDRATVRAAWNEAASRGHLQFEGRLRNAGEDCYRHFQTRAEAVRAPDGAVLEWLGTSTEVDNILRLQERQSILVAELQHRTRNLMAVVQSVILRTIRGSQSLEDFSAQVSERIQALARVQGILSQRAGGKRVAFDTLLRSELSAHVELDAEGKAAQISIEGPIGIPLQSSLVQTFALALHELATNAVKYGALASPQGHLTVRWSKVLSADSRPCLHLDWRESGVADMPADGAKPYGDGYGRELIERALPYQLGARTSYCFTGDGVHCTIEMEIPKDETKPEANHG